MQQRHHGRDRVLHLCQAPISAGHAIFAVLGVSSAPRRSSAPRVVEPSSPPSYMTPPPKSYPFERLTTSPLHNHDPKPAAALRHSTASRPRVTGKQHSCQKPYLFLLRQ